MSVLEKLRADIRHVLHTADVVKSLTDMGFSADKAQALADTKGMRSARTLAADKSK